MTYITKNKTRSPTIEQAHPAENDRFCPIFMAHHSEYFFASDENIDAHWNELCATMTIGGQSTD